MVASPDGVDVTVSAAMLWSGVLRKLDSPLASVRDRPAISKSGNS